MTRPGSNAAPALSRRAAVGDEEDESRSGETLLRSRGEEATILRPAFSKASTTAKDSHKQGEPGDVPSANSPAPATARQNRHGNEPE
ncbi:MAG TPA: hypothetical protein DCZ69_02290, partial [Syntrophobacteraceae bacterium]|nr:hypothetical protein [Syntrophobacteraceae bacterium]